MIHFLCDTNQILPQLPKGRTSFWSTLRRERLHDHSGAGGSISHLFRVCPAAATESWTGERTKAVTLRGTFPGDVPGQQPQSAKHGYPAGWAPAGGILQNIRSTTRGCRHTYPHGGAGSSASMTAFARASPSCAASSRKPAPWRLRMQKWRLPQRHWSGHSLVVEHVIGPRLISDHVVGVIGRLISRRAAGADAGRYGGRR